VKDAPEIKEDLMKRMKRLREVLERANQGLGPQPDSSQGASDELIRVLKGQGYL